MTDLNSYESLGVLAAALYGDVFKLRHRVTGELLALKRMDLVSAARRRTKDTNRPIEEDVFAEVQTNMKLRRLGGHRHVVAMRDCFADDQTVSLMTEFCAHGELLDVVNARGSLLPVEDVLQYFHQILQAVAFLHKHNIAHRDLSLENVLVDDFDCCKLSDFGMATSTTRLRASGIGKVHYMAPEACREEGQAARFYNPFEADVWSLGVILLTLLTGQYPFQTALDSDAHFVLLKTQGVEALMERLCFETDEYQDIVDLLSRMVCVDAADRATAAELLTHECFDVFSVAETVAEFEDEQDVVDEDSEDEDVDAEVNPASDNECDGDAVATPKSVAPLRSYLNGEAGLFMLRRPPPIDTSGVKALCTFVMPSSKKSPAAMKEQRSSVIALTPKLSMVSNALAAASSRSNSTCSNSTCSATVRPPRRSPKWRKKSAFRGMLDGVFRRKKARASPSVAKTY